MGASPPGGQPGFRLLSQACGTPVRTRLTPHARQQQQQQRRGLLVKLACASAAALVLVVCFNSLRRLLLQPSWGGYPFNTPIANVTGVPVVPLLYPVWWYAPFW